MNFWIQKIKSKMFNAKELLESFCHICVLCAEGKFIKVIHFTLYKITKRSSSFPCKSPTTVTVNETKYYNVNKMPSQSSSSHNSPDLEMAVDARFMFSILLNFFAASLRIPATYFACNLY